MNIRRMDFVHINGEGELVERCGGSLTDWISYEGLAADLADCRLIAREQEDAHIAANLRNTHLSERIEQLEALASRKAAEWAWLDDSIKLLEAALKEIPECYRDGDPSQLHFEIKAHLARVGCSAAQNEPKP